MMTKTLDLNKIGCIDIDLVDSLQPRMIPDFDDNCGQRIYHYTSIGGLQGILGGKLRFTHIGYMNDRDEVVAGSDALRELSLKYCDDALVHVIEQEAERNKALSAYVCCFSLERDSLAMWNYYTKDPNNQGYNLVFDYRELIISILQKNKELNGCQISFGKVDYCNKEENYFGLAHKQYVRNIASALQGLATLSKLLSDPAQKPETLPKEIVCPTVKEEYPSVIKYYGDEPRFHKTISADTIFFMKRPCFAIESEFRIVIQVPDAVLSKFVSSSEGKAKYKYRVSNGLLIPYLELDIDLASLTGLTASPTLQSDLAEKSIKSYCEYCGIEVSKLPDGIEKSKIPVRF